MEESWEELWNSITMDSNEEDASLIIEFLERLEKD